MKKNYIFFLAVFLLGSTAIAQNMDGVVKKHLSSHAGLSEVGFTTQDASEWKVTDVVPSLNPEIQHVYVQQMYQGIPIENGRYKFTVKNGEVTWSINQFIGDVAAKAAKTSLSLSPENAIMKVVSEHQLNAPTKLQPFTRGANTIVYEDSGISLEPIQVDKIYIYKEGNLKLAWKVSLYQLDGQHWWNTIIDGTSGAVLHNEDWVVSCSFGTSDHLNHNHTATEEPLEMKPTTYSSTSVDASLVGGGSYNVYPLGIESPNHGNRTIVTDPANASASPFGWHDTNGSAGAEFTTTRGNNVLAQDDTNGNNGSGATPNGGGNLNFDFPLNLNNNPSTFLPAATTNLFYWNNIMHDVWYQYGFNEASGNFQENNYGNGGSGSDSVNADAQDGSGTNNANFSTPPDGQNPRMQMFLFTNPTRDGDLDNVIIAHEYGHGISTRLVGGPGTNALGGSEQMGEGWSDWFGLVMTIRPGDTRNTARGVGTYAIGEPTTGAGIRPTRYSPDLAVNDTDYGDIGGLSIPHGVGYGFATILWDMTWDLIDQEGYDADQYNGTGGNNIAMALVIEGLKNTANNPGYVSGRDGILQADQDLYGGQYNCLIWDAFARRGVGLDAVENSNGGTNTNTDQITSFTSGCTGPPPPTSCDDTVASFPYNEGFENTLGDWSQGSGDDFDWTLRTGGTPSSSTGPSGAFQGSHYVYVEASSPNFGGRTTILNSPCFDFTNGGDPEASFYYQMTGNSVGTIRLEVRENDSQTWTEVWSQSGDQGADWIEALVDLSAYSGDMVQLRFSGTTNTSWQGDIAIDAFNLTTSDTEAPSNPSSLAVTGVTTDSVNLSWNASTDNVGVVAYEVFQDNSLLGEIAGTSANVTGLAEGTTYQYRIRARDEAGNVSGNSNTVSATTETAGSTGCVGGESAPYSESYEANLGLWSQGGGDDLNWTRDSGGTPSSNTGPASGADGSFYVFVEASGNGTGFPNKRAILNSPCLDLSGEDEASFIFNYHMFGSADGGSVDLEVSTDNGSSWSSIWNQTGNQGNQWNEVEVDLGAYVGSAIQLRFNRVTGGTWQADVAIDNTRLVSGGDSSGCSMVDLDTDYNSFATQDNGEDALLNGNTELRIRNNAWKFIDFDYNVTSNTVIQFDFRSTIQGEIHGIALESDNTLSSNISFKVHGTQNWGIQDFDNYPNNGQWVTYTIDVGNFYTGAADRLLFIADHDSTPSNGDSFFRNVTVFEDANGNGVCDGQEGSAFDDFAGSTPEPINGNVGVDEVAGTFDFEIFPNPVTKGTLSISLIGTEAQQLTIYNMLGQVIRKGAFTEIVDVSYLTTGAYLLEIEVDGDKMIKRFIKE